MDIKRYEIPTAKAGGNYGHHAEASNYAGVGPITIVRDFFDVNSWTDVSLDRFGNVFAEYTRWWNPQPHYMAYINAPDGSRYEYGGGTNPGVQLFINYEKYTAPDGSYVSTGDVFDPSGEYVYPPPQYTENFQTRYVSYEVSSSPSAAGVSTYNRTYSDGSKSIDIRSEDGSNRHIDYDKTGVAYLEQRTNSAGVLTYEVRGAKNSEHTSTLVQADGTHIAHYGADGKTIVLNEHFKTDGTIFSVALADGQTLGGGAGNDTFTGKPFGSDTFVFGADFANDTIRYFETGRDVIKFIDPEIDASDVSLSYTGYGQNTVLTVAGEGSITLVGVHLNSVDELQINMF